MAEEARSKTAAAWARRRLPDQLESPDRKPIVRAVKSTGLSSITAWPAAGIVARRNSFGADPRSIHPVRDRPAPGLPKLRHARPGSACGFP